MDEGPYSGINYYRLKQTDKNGDYKYSGVVGISTRGKQIFEIVPNPAFNKTEVIYNCHD